MGSSVLFPGRWAVPGAEDACAGDSSNPAPQQSGALTSLEAHDHNAQRSQSSPPHTSGQGLGGPDLGRRHSDKAGSPSQRSEGLPHPGTTQTC